MSPEYLLFNTKMISSVCLEEKLQTEKHMQNRKRIFITFSEAVIIKSIENYFIIYFRYDFNNNIYTIPCSAVAAEEKKYAVWHFFI